jgi:hypothetical protein
MSAGNMRPVTQGCNHISGPFATQQRELDELLRTLRISQTFTASLLETGQGAVELVTSKVVEAIMEFSRADEVENTGGMVAISTQGMAELTT